MFWESWNLGFVRCYCNKLASRGIDGVVKKIVAILHAKVDRPAGFRGGQEDIALTMYNSEIDFEDGISCCYCAEEQRMFLEPCHACEKNMFVKQGAEQVK